MKNWGVSIFSNWQLGMRVYMRMVMILMLECKLCHIKKLALKGTMFPHWKIFKWNLDFSDEKTHSEIDHIVVDRIWHSSILDVGFFRRANCDTDHSLVIATVMERLGGKWGRSTEVWCGEIQSQEVKCVGILEKIWD